MKRLIVISFVMLFALGSCFASLVFIAAFVDSETDDCETESVSGSISNAALSPSGLTVKGNPMTVPQARNAQAIIRAAFSEGLSVQAALVGIMTAFQESTLLNLPYGYPGSTSLGLFQQIEAWGPRHVRMDPYLSAQMFFTGGRNGQAGLADIDGWEQMSPGDAAQAVQRSGFPDAYAPHQVEAEAIIAAYTGDETASTVLNVGANNCPVEDPIEVAVLAATSREGDVYDWEDADGSGLVSWAFNQAGISLPESKEGLAAYKGDETAGVTAEYVTGNNLEPVRGDIPFLSDDGDEIADSVGVEKGPVGVDKGSSFRLATYNITVKKQFADYPRVIDNIKNEYNLDIVGTQELENENYGIIQRGMTQDGTFGIYPDKKPGDRIVRHGLNARSILYRADRFELDESKSTFFRYPRYAEDGPAQSGDEQILAGQANAPVAFFNDIETGQTLIVINFHNAAFKENAERRYRSNLIIVDQVKTLQDDHPGVPIFLTGDFNEGTGVRGPGDGANYTYQQHSENLLYCMFASNKLMFSTEAESRGQATNCPNPQIGGVDYTYASQGVQVAPQSFTEIPRVASGSDHPAKFVDVVVPDTNLSASQPAGDTSFSVGFKSGNVDEIQVNTSKIVGILRLSVVEPIMTVSNDENSTWVSPMIKGTYVRSSTTGGNYGWRIHPIRGTPDFHNGTDLGAVTGARVNSIGSGRVLRNEFHSCWGNLVVIDHGEFLSLYTHLDSITFGLIVGEEVRAGQQIGVVGNTGECSAGSHLHFTTGTSLEILSGEEAGSVDPVVFMLERGIVL